MIEKINTHVKVNRENSTKLCPFCNDYNRQGTIFLTKITKSIDQTVPLLPNESNIINSTYICMNCGFEAFFYSDTEKEALNINE